MRLFTAGLFLSFAILGRMQWLRATPLSVTFFDVGQGDSALIQFPNRSAWLVDAGGGFEDWDVGRDLVMELARYGVLSLDSVVVSHPDLDHVLGFRSVLDQIPVRNLVLNHYFLGPKQSTPFLRWMRGNLEKGGGTIHSVVGLKPFGIAGARGRFFVGQVKSEKANEHSLVLELEYAGCRFLFTGDLEKEGEAALNKSPLAGAYSVIKAAHHGSKTSTSSDFLAAFSSPLVVISSGAGNSYGHPHSRVLQRLHRNGTSVFRTDFHGAIRFEVFADGRLTCTTAHGSCGTLKCP